MVNLRENAHQVAEYLGGVDVVCPEKEENLITR